jgi:cell division septation protein DedD
MVTVLAVLGLAVIGTAGAFGYRTLVSGPKSTAPPPVIRASDEPSKVAPPPASNEPTNKLSYDRFGDRGQNERVVAREEKPIDTRELSRSSGPRVILPGAPIPSNTGPGGSGVPGNTGSASLGVVPSSPRTVPSALGEPRRVRTLQIRPDQPDAAGSPNQMAALPSLPQQVQAPAVPHDNTPPHVAVEPPPAAVSPPPVRPRATAPRPTSPRPAPPPSGADAPLSLSPESSAELPPPGRSSAPVRTSPASQPTRVASAPSGGGSYLVQVSSQRSEADAQSAYRSLRAKYSSVLGDRQHVIRRADLGSKGVYYRAMVGPFGSREEAIQVCGNLKAAGGDCVVQSN